MEMLRRARDYEFQCKKALDLFKLAGGDEDDPKQYAALEQALAEAKADVAFHAEQLDGAARAA
jgi:hypothetical protein